MAGLGDAGGSGLKVFDEIVPELEVTRSQYEDLREGYLDWLGYVPHDVPASTALSFDGRRVVRTPVAARPVSAAERARARAATRFVKPGVVVKDPDDGVWLGPRTLEQALADNRFSFALPPLSTAGPEGTTVLSNPSGRTTFPPAGTQLWVSGVYGRDPTRWVDLPPGSRVFVRADHPWITPEVLAEHPQVDVPIWTGGEDRITRMVAIPARRAGVSTGARHELSVLRNGSDGTALGYIGWYEPGGSGAFFETGVGKFLARELAAGIVEVAVNIVGGVVAAATSAVTFGAAAPLAFGASAAAGSAAGAAVAGPLRDALSANPLVHVVESQAANASGTTVVAAIESSYAVNPKAVNQVFADAAVVSTYLAGLDNVLLGLGDLFRNLAIMAQDDPAAVARRVQESKARISGVGGEVLGYAALAANAIASMVASVTPAAPFVALVKALVAMLQTALANEALGSDQYAALGSALLKVAASMVPAASGPLTAAAEVLEAGTAGEWSDAGRAATVLVADLVPVVGGALATAGRAALLVADVQDRLRAVEHAADVADDRKRAAELSASARSASAELAMAVGVARAPAAVDAAIATAKPATARAMLVDDARAALHARGIDPTAAPGRGVRAAVACGGTAAAWLAHALLGRS